MTLAALRLGGVAAAVQTGRDHAEAPSQAGRDLVPGKVGLDMAVQPHERRPAPPLAR